MPPCGPSNEAYLSSPHLEASPAMTFHACSSPAPTPVKPQPAHAILSQESVHTMLSITNHTGKRPSTGPRTTHGPQQSRSVPACSPRLAHAARQFYSTVVSSATQVLRWRLGCGFYQPARPLSPSRLLPLGQRGWMVESLARTQNSIVSIHNTARQVFDYST
jgi:hypothetical protein